MLALLSLLLVLPSVTVAAPIGICYGRVADNLPSSSEVVNLLKSNGITNIRIFNPDPFTLQSFSGAGISLMIGVPNEILPSVASGGPIFSLQWLQTNIFPHIPPNQIRYIAVGNEIPLKDPYYTPYMVSAMRNLHQALQTLNLANSIKLSSPQAASVLSVSYPPSSGTFDPFVKSAILPLLQFLHDTQSPLMVNYFEMVALTYSNLFDASVDAFVYAMEKEGFAGIPVVVTETGWPTSGGTAASAENALAFNENVVRRAVTSIGTPKRPGEGVEAYLFDLFDENRKVGEEYEKHFGIFRIDGSKIYDIRFN
ncbi:Glucan endo-1,3-beta-glucosidase [Melia azedarach]|uniref:Glucan endo-1,3-beta-glucosidase n=1 Tax=Melia azedarach TaxID=155640 RepID=A0ACC1XHV6_MELAZ|nr:Glucan endo-1,3-beta-glucosidase [Melia azedarach]